MGNSVHQGSDRSGTSVIILLTTLNNVGSTTMFNVLVGTWSSQPIMYQPMMCLVLLRTRHIIGWYIIGWLLQVHTAVFINPEQVVRFYVCCLFLCNVAWKLSHELQQNMIWFGDFFAFMFARICNKLDMYERLTQNIFVCINTQDMSAEITVYMNHF